MGVRVLVISSDTFPPTRVDVAVLFGKELAGRGHRFDWILQSEAACARSYVTSWGGGEAWVGATDLGNSLLRRLHKHALGIGNDLRLLTRLRRTRYDAVEVKDKFLTGAIAAIACRISRTPFIYWLSYRSPSITGCGRRMGRRAIRGSPCCAAAPSDGCFITGCCRQRIMCSCRASKCAKILPRTASRLRR